MNRFLGGIGGIHPSFVTIEKGHYMIKQKAGAVNPNIHLTYDIKRKSYRRAKLVVQHQGQEYIAYAKNVKDLVYLALDAHRQNWSSFLTKLSKYQ